MAALGALGMTALSNTASSAGSAAGGGIAGAIGGWIGDLLGTNKKADERQIKQQQKLTDMQVAANKSLADYGMGIQKEMYDYTNIKAQKKLLEEAGMNPALMYGSGNTGGVTGSVSAGSAGQGQAANAAQTEGLELQKAEMGLRLQNMAKQNDLLEAEIKNKEVDTLYKEADIRNKDANTKTQEQQRDILTAKLLEEGKAVKLENLKAQWLMSNEKNRGDSLISWDNTLGEVYIDKDSYIDQEITTSIAEAQAETGSKVAQAALTDARTKGYWQELLNATAHADADKIKAAATKLAVDWETGEYTNWRTFATEAKEGIKTLGSILRK